MCKKRIQTMSLALGLLASCGAAWGMKGDVCVHTEDYLAPLSNQRPTLVEHKLPLLTQPDPDLEKLKAIHTEFKKELSRQYGAAEGGLIQIEASIKRNNFLSTVLLPIGATLGIAGTLGLAYYIIARPIGKVTGHIDKLFTRQSLLRAGGSLAAAVIGAISGMASIILPMAYMDDCRVLGTTETLEKATANYQKELILFKANKKTDTNKNIEQLSKDLNQFVQQGLKNKTLSSSCNEDSTDHHYAVDTIQNTYKFLNAKSFQTCYTGILGHITEQKLPYRRIDQMAI